MKNIINLKQGLVAELSYESIYSPEMKLDGGFGGTDPEYFRERVYIVLRTEDGKQSPRLSADRMSDATKSLGAYLESRRPEGATILIISDDGYKSVWLTDTLPYSEVRQAVQSFAEASRPEEGRRIMDAKQAKDDELAAQSAREAAESVLSIARTGRVCENAEEAKAKARAWREANLEGGGGYCPSWVTLKQVEEAREVVGDEYENE